MEKMIRTTRSLCPVCLKNLPAHLAEQEDGQIFLKKTCPDHGDFAVPIWRGKVDFRQWVQYSPPLAETEGLSCPANCGICGDHQIGTCCILLEVTRRCNLRCRFCFANGGAPEEDPDLEELKEAVTDIVRQCGQPLLQLSGGEPTLREDLPELVRFAKEAGCSYVQLNTNGIRLAEDPPYVKALADAGLDIVFLQFDGTDDAIYKYLRGKPLLETKKQAIQICSDLHIGVTLVPTVVPGINDRNLGKLVRFARERVPGVRGVHFQPVSYFGRYAGTPAGEDRYTLDQLMADLSDQADIPVESFMPSRCDHPLCGFHADFLLTSGGGLRPLTSITRSARERGCARDNREYVARHWRRPEEEPGTDGLTPAGSGGGVCAGEQGDEEMDFDTFLYRLRHGSLCLSAMAFQDAMNLNIERLVRCSLHVYDQGTVKPFCAKYVTPMEPQPHKRRVRYGGTHPRRFEEKYKEQNPEKYRETVERVIRKGSTPAGMHISICVQEILDFFQIQPGQKGLDVTLGYGGHTRRMLEQLQGQGCIYGLDVDPIEIKKTKERLAVLGYGDEILKIRQMNFADIGQLSKETGRFDFVLADLGVSSMQIDDPRRGFTYKEEGPLDLRLNPESGISAAERLETISPDELQGMLEENADELYAAEITREVMKRRCKKQKIETTTQFREAIQAALSFLPEKEQKEAVKKSCQRCFQALRIDVNNEFEVLYRFLESLPDVLAPGGRAAILTFHSGEDRLVKRFFKEGKKAGLYSEIAENVIRPSAEECARNPRARSAKMRWAIRSVT